MVVVSAGGVLLMRLNITLTMVAFEIMPVGHLLEFLVMGKRAVYCFSLGGSCVGRHVK